MDDTELLADALEDLLRRYSGDASGTADDGSASTTAWAAFAETGFPWVSVSHEAGGAGGDIDHATIITYGCGRYATPAPVAETILAGRLLASAGMNVQSEPMTVASDPHLLVLRQTGSKWSVSGRARHVPWASEAERLAAVCVFQDQEFVISIPTRVFSIVEDTNVAEEPRSAIAVDYKLESEEIARDPTPGAARQLLLDGALLRSAQICGALDRVADLTLRYTSERIQFGRPIRQFQAVQHHLVAIAGGCAVARMAVLEARRAVMYGDEASRFASVATAKAVTSAEAGKIAAAAHQVHGAIGMTKEYPLSTFTRALWAWRDDFGSEHFWHSQIGSWVLASPSGNLWHMITDS